VQIVLPGELNAYDVLVSDWMVFSRATLESTIAKFGTGNAHSAPTERAPAAGVSPDAASEAKKAAPTERAPEAEETVEDQE
jgi:hypothetical protein